MKNYLLRHGLTAYNKEKRYQGTRDIPLCDEGRRQLAPAPICPDRVYVSPLVRARETAEILFPHTPLTVMEDLREMCFGIFEGRNYIEMEHDPAPAAVPAGKPGENFRTAAAPPSSGWWRRALPQTVRKSPLWLTAGPRWR